eukprot:3087975-Alexandrium_andersonii.AAC.1
MQNRFRRSELELRGPRSGLKICPRSARGVHSARLFAPIPNPTVEGAALVVPRGSRRGSRG